MAELCIGVRTVVQLRGDDGDDYCRIVAYLVDLGVDGIGTVATACIGEFIGSVTCGVAYYYWSDAAGLCTAYVAAGGCACTGAATGYTGDGMRGDAVGK